MPSTLIALVSKALHPHPAAPLWGPRADGDITADAAAGCGEPHRTDSGDRASRQSLSYSPGTRGSRLELASQFQIRAVAGPASALQSVLSGGPYTVWSYVRHVQVVWPPPRPRQAW